MKKTLLALATLASLVSRPAFAVLDVNDRGPVLNRGNFNLRVTNAGILGNPFLDKGLSNDPSFESPPGSGFELLNYAALWVGGVPDGGSARVSGGPLLEFRPTLDSADHVWLGEFGRLGSKRFYDDDNDGRTDEEILNNKDDDGDFEVDEDLGLFCQQTATADYVDDRPEAVQFVYPGGEQHRPLGLSVHQEVYAWAVPGFDRAAGVTYTITNHGDHAVRDVYLGVLVDGDSKLRNDRAGHLNDVMQRSRYSRTYYAGWDSITLGGVIPCQRRPCPPGFPCYTTLAQSFPVIGDGLPGAELPYVAAVGLHHKTDPIAGIFGAGHPFARAPRNVNFRYFTFANGRVPGQGGLPVTDVDRYVAMQGGFPQANTSTPDDYVVLVSCGPFPLIEPGGSVDFSIALIAGATLDSIAVEAGNMAILEDGVRFNRQPDNYRQPWPRDYDRRETGINGHEACVEPPPGVEFDLDPDCPQKFANEFDSGPTPVPQHYEHGRCIWTDADCDRCTGNDGWDTFFRWADPGMQPPPPSFRLAPKDHAVEIAWDNRPEILLQANLAGGSETKFVGYYIWKLQDWRERESLVPPRPRWALVAAFALDTLLGANLLSDYTDPSLDYERILYEQPLYPVGRYRYLDPDVLNGFDYLYVVTTVFDVAVRDSNGYISHRIAYAPIATEFAQRVVPRTEARASGNEVWVVPNPFRANADWDRPRTLGDELTRHIDFMGLPRARVTIKIWTVAGDLVAQLDHDGSGGDGQAAWDLVSRNGQDVASGVYLFTVESALGHQTGRFVVVR